MINNVFKILEKLGFGSQTRAISAQFSNPLLNAQVFVQRIDGQSGINVGNQFELLCLSTNANLELKQFMGCQVAVDAVTDLGQLNRTTGIVTGAVQGQSDGSLTVYKLKVQDATALWAKRRNSRVFMSKTIPEIVQTVFKEWQQRSPLFASSLSLDLSGLTQDYDVRPFTMQHNQTDQAFLTQLLKKAGINYFIDEAQTFVTHNSEPIQAQKLRLVDDNYQFQALPRRSIRFHRSDATERFDTITQFIAERSLQPTSVHIQRWQPDALEQEDGAGSVLSWHKHSERHDNESLALEDAWHISPAWMQDLNGEDGATKSGNAQVEKLNANLSKQHNLNAKYFTAHSTVRDAQIGYWFTFSGHPEIDEHKGSDQEFLILSKHFYNQNNLPKDVQKQVENLLTQSRWQDQIIEEQDQRQGNTLTLVRRSTAVVPQYHPEKDKPIVHVQRAKVVGLEGEQIHVDEWGRIKVRFLFSREEDNTHDGGAGSNNTDTDSAWVDVLTPWAGEGYGARFLPRVGEVVVVDFFDGNPDRPFVIGRLHEAERAPTQFDQKGKLPDTKKLSGIRSQEVDGNGFNQLRLDDTTGQISAQLQSSHGASQLNLGNLSHPKETETSEGRGEGFELRTDAWGAVRAGKGLLVSTYAQENALGSHLDAAEAQALLKQGQDNIKELGELALKQQSDAVKTINKLPKFIQSLEIKNSNEAVKKTVDLFKQNLTQDSVSALKETPKFIADIEKFAPKSHGVQDALNDFMRDCKDTVGHLKHYVENLQDHASEEVQGMLASLKEKIPHSPLDALKEAGQVLNQVNVQDIDYLKGCGSFPQTNPNDPPLTAKILQPMKKFLEGYAKGLQNSPNKEKQEQGTLFRQALMLFASPEGIAFTTPQSIIQQANEDISLSANETINLSAQHNVMVQALEKISLFASTKGMSAKAAKGKIDIHAQDDMIELIARKMIQIISTEDVLEFVSPKGISFTSGTSKLTVAPDGIHLKTLQGIYYHATQHQFKKGEKMEAKIPELPKQGPHAINFLLSDLAGRAQKDAKVEIVNTQTKEPIWQGKTNALGTTSISVLDEKQTYKALVGYDYWASEFEDEELHEHEEQADEDNIDLGEHEAPQTEIVDEMITNKGNKNV